MFLICSQSGLIYHIEAMTVALRKSADFDSAHLEMGGVASARRKGRGAETNRSGRYKSIAYEPADDGWESLADLEALATEVREVPARRIITRNSSPDIGFDRSINPYRGCEHGCIYCFARPTHAFLGLSPGLDFETKLFAKTNAAALWSRSLPTPTIAPATSPSAPIPIRISPSSAATASCDVSWRCSPPPITPSASSPNPPSSCATSTCFAPWRAAASSRWRSRSRHSTANSRAPWSHERARRTSGSRPLPNWSRRGSPPPSWSRPSFRDSPTWRWRGFSERSAAAGVRNAGYVLLRLPLEIGDLFTEWLRGNCPDRANRVLSLMRSTRGGKLYDAKWGERMVGEGPYAWMIGRRFEIAAERLGFNKELRRASYRSFHAPRPSRPAAPLAVVELAHCSPVNPAKVGVQCYLRFARCIRLVPAITRGKASRIGGGGFPQR